MHECVHLTQGIPQAPLQNTKQHASSVTVSIRPNLVQSISPQLPTVLQKPSCLLIAHSTVLCEALRKRKHFHGKINIQTCRSKNGGEGEIADTTAITHLKTQCFPLVVLQICTRSKLYYLANTLWWIFKDIISADTISEVAVKGSSIWIFEIQRAHASKYGVYLSLGQIYLKKEHWICHENQYSSWSL